MASPNVGQLLDLLATVPAQGHENALSYVMSEWTMHQGELAQFTMLRMYSYWTVFVFVFLPFL